MHTVLHYPNNDLRIPARPVSSFSSKPLHDLVREMLKLMRQHRGIGLAATQIGIAEQIAVIEMKDAPLVLINPVLSNVAEQQEREEEGCLSVPGIYGIVPRAVSLHLRAQDAEGQWYETDAKGLFARVIQHEVDHLQGRLFIDRTTRLTEGLEKARALGIEKGGTPRA